MNRWLALVFGLLLPTMGQIYIRKYKEAFVGFITLSMLFALVIVLSLKQIISFGTCVFLIISITLIIQVGLAAKAFIDAQKINKVDSKNSFLRFGFALGILIFLIVGLKVATNFFHEKRQSASDRMQELGKRSIEISAYMDCITNLKDNEDIKQCEKLKPQSFSRSRARSKCEEECMKDTPDSDETMAQLCSQSCPTKFDE